MEQTFIALTEDDQPRMYGYGSGVGHAILIPADAMGDPLCVGGSVETACGRTVDVDRLTEKFTGDRECARCVKWLASDGGRNDVEAAREAKYARYADGPDGGPELGADVAPARELTRDDVREIVRQSRAAQRKARKGAAVAAERERLAQQAEKRDAGQLITFRVEGEPVTGPSEGERAELIERERARRTAGACDGTGKVPAPGTRVQRDDHTVSVPDDYNGKHSAKCPACSRIIAVSREGVMRRHNAAPAKGADTREVSAPIVAPVESTDAREVSAPVQGDLFVGVTGLTHAEMRAELDRYYANGGKVPAEILALPDPTRVRIEWSGTDASDGGSVTPCDFKGDVEIINPEKTHGKCPECRAYIALQDVKSDPDANRIGKHNRYGVANPPRPKILLSSESLGTVEHGSVPGSQADADKRRAAETRCDASGKMARGADGRARTTGGAYKCTHVIAENGTVCGRTVELDKRIRQTKKGKVTRWFIPNHTEGRDSFRSNGNGGYVAGERKVTPRGSGADAGKGQRDHGSVDGSANTGAQNMPPVRPGGWVGTAGTMSLPATVRPGVDPEVSGKWCPICEERVDVAHKGKGRSWWRNHGKRMAAYHKGREAEREAQRAADIEAGRRLPAGTRKAARKAVSVGSFAEGTVAGEVQHEGARPASDSRLKPYSKRTASPLEREILGDRRSKSQGKGKGKGRRSSK